MKRFFILTLGVITIALMYIRSAPVIHLNTTQKNIHVRVMYHLDHFEIELEPYATVEDLLEHVELADDVDFNKVNLKQILAHNDTYAIPILSDTPCISINTGSLDDLMSLKGVGEKTALAIIAHRESQGLFQSLEELMDVKGIGAAKFEALRESACL